MKDPDIEDLLRKYRPAGPPPELRERVLAAAAAPRGWPWAAAAAALLAVAITSQLAARGETARVQTDLGPWPSARLVDDLASILGGDARARQMAELIIAERQGAADTLSTGIERDIAPGDVQR